MNTIKITNINTAALVDVNFTLAEFWLPAKKDFILYSCLVLALQTIRDYFKVAWLVTSTYRPNDPLWMPEAHRVQPPAVDSVPLDINIRVEILEKIRNELKRWENSELIKNVLATGCNVIIIENTCLHIHRRNYSLDYPKDYPNGIYLGEWGLKDGNQFNIAYSH